MDLTLLPGQLELIKNIANDEGIKNYQLEISVGKQKGDGYMSNIILVSIISSEKTFKILLKVASDSVKLREQVPAHKAFYREYFIYNEVFPHYEKLQKKFASAFIPVTFTKLYDCTLKEYEECLVLENLKEKGFQLWDKKLPMNDHHVKLTFQTYGKFHALSFITRYLYTDKYKKWMENTNNIRKDFFKDSFDQQLKELFDNIQNLFEEKDIKHKITNLYRHWRDAFFLDCKEKYAVLTHGDSWCNNFLYKYENSKDTTKPIDIRMLDFQIAMLDTPVHDLSYFLFTNTDKECYSKYRDFLAVYHNTMTSVLKYYDLDINEVYPYKILTDHWKKYAKFGLYWAIIVLKTNLISEEDVIDMDNLAESGCDVYESFMGFPSEDEEYKFRVKELIQFFLDDNLM